MRHGALSWITGTVLLASLAIPSTGLAQEQAQDLANKHTRYTLVDLGTLGGPDSEVQGNAVVINRRGEVAGDANTAVYDPGCGCYISHAFKWHKGVLTDLGTLPGGSNSMGIAINAQGAVVGTSENGLIDPVYGLPVFVATLWKDGDIDDLGTLGGGFSLPNSINDRGQIAGFAANTEPDPDGFAALLIFGVALPGNQWHATLWQNGTIHDLGTLSDGLTSAAFHVNERGQVAGFSFVDTTPTVFGFPTVHPFLWENGHMLDLGSLGGVFASPAALNNRGQVAGFSTLPGDSTNHAFLWDHGRMKDLGTLGGTYSAAYWLNDRGEVIGRSSPPDDQSFHAFLWKQGAMTDLGALPGDTFSQALGINSSGQIVGQSFNDDGSDVFRACLWESGNPPVDLDDFRPLGSSVHLHEPLFINDRGEIVVKALLPDGDAHVFILIPAGGDVVDSTASATSAGPDAVRASKSSAGTTHDKLTPEKLAELRARFVNRRGGFGINLPKSTR